MEKKKKKFPERGSEIDGAGNSYLRNAISMWCGVVYVNKVMDERQEDKRERERKREKNGKSLQVRKATREHCLEERG